MHCVILIFQFLELCKLKYGMKILQKVIQYLIPMCTASLNRSGSKAAATSSIILHTKGLLLP